MLEPLWRVLSTKLMLYTCAFFFPMCWRKPVCLAEREFCVSFFGLDTQQQQQQSQQQQQGDDNGRPAERSFNDELRKMMSKLFAVLELEFVSFLATFEKIDSLWVSPLSLFSFFYSFFHFWMILLNFYSLRFFSFLSWILHNFSWVWSPSGFLTTFEEVTVWIHLICCA